MENKFFTHITFAAIVTIVTVFAPKPSQGATCEAMCASAHEDTSGHTCHQYGRLPEPEKVHSPCKTTPEACEAACQKDEWAASDEHTR